jgi:hypothetical protein
MRKGYTVHRKREVLAILAQNNEKFEQQFDSWNLRENIRRRPSQREILKPEEDQELVESSDESDEMTK